MIIPGGNSAGMSFIECTAMSALPSVKRGFEFLDEETLASGRGKRALDPVALRDHRQQAHDQSRVGGRQTLGNMLGLPQGERAFPRRDADLPVHASF